MASNLSLDIMSSPKQSNPSLKRKNSKFDLQNSEDSMALYRPEFGGKKGEETKNQKMWELMQTYKSSSSKDIQKQIVSHVEYTLARTRFNFDNFGAYQATALAVRDRLIEAWNDTQ